MKANYFFNAILVASLFLITSMAGCDNSSTDVEIDADAPLIFSTSPLNNENDIERNRSMEIVFDQAMDPTTINNSTITLQQGTTQVNGSVDYSGTAARFTSDNILDAQTDYTAKVSTGARSASGVALANDHEWNFTTGGNSEQLEAIELGSAGNYVILAKSAINNNPSSAFTGDLGLSPMAESFITT